MSEKIPNEYQAINENPKPPQLVGTDIYLAGVAALWTAGMMHLFAMTVVGTYNLVPHPNIVHLVVWVPALLSALNILTDSYSGNIQTRPPMRRRLWNAVSSSLGIVFFALFTIPAQIGQSLTSGVSITRNLFD